MVQVGLILLSVLMFSFILVGYRNALIKNGKDVTKNLLLVVVAVVGWLTYVSILSGTKFLHTLELPPRFPLTIIVPFFAFGIIFYIKNKDNKTLQSLPLKWTALFQSFRIVVELFLYALAVDGILTNYATFEGYNFDILMGIIAPIIFYLIIKNRIGKKSLIVLNLLGIAMVLFVGFIVATTMYFPGIWGSNEQLTSYEFIDMPNLLVACFLAPMAIFIHVVSLIQLRAIK